MEMVVLNITLSPASYEGVQADGDCSVVVTRYNSQQVV
jgi:hypothetical protein